MRTYSLIIMKPYPADNNKLFAVHQEMWLRMAWGKTTIPTYEFLFLFAFCIKFIIWLHFRIVKTVDIHNYTRSEHIFIDISKGVFIAERIRERIKMLNMRQIRYHFTYRWKWPTILHVKWPTILHVKSIAFKTR